MTDSRAQVLEQSGAAAEGEFSSGRADGAVRPCSEQETTWIDIVLVDEHDRPVPGTRFIVYRPDGSILGQGVLDAKGCGGFEGIEDGDYEVTFPELDEATWQPGDTP